MKPRSQKTRIWGLTGGVASGKSTAARFFAQAGIPVIDADQIAQELRTPGSTAHDRIVKEFGTADRTELRKKVFADADARKKLEGILHPLIQKESLKRIEALGAERVIYEAALLVETGRYKDFQGLIVIESPAEQRIKRLVSRDRISRELAQQMIASQISDPDRRKVATHVIENNSSLEDLQKKIQSLSASL